jgi:mono/diheme cytochrome c family protein
VKRHEGFNPATNDWEFFFLSVSPEGTDIEVRGVEDVENRFGGNCASCHSAADSRFDFVCEDDHGCEPLPIDDNLIFAIQESDPRPVER